MMLKWLLGFVLLGCIWAAPAEAACAGGICFFKGGTASGATNNTANWSVVSTSGAACTCVPTTTDAVIMDSGSTSPMLINTALSVGTLDASGAGGTGLPYTGTITHSNSITLTINTAAANSLLFTASLTYTPGNSASLVTFVSATGTSVLTTGGQNFAAVTVATGSTGTIGVQLADNLNVTAVSGAILTLTSGTLDASTNSKTITAALFASSGATARTLALGGTMTIGGIRTTAGANIWSTATATNFTGTYNSNNLAVAPFSGIQGAVISTGAITMPALVVNANTGAQFTLGIVGAATWPSITLGSGWNLNLPSATTETVSGNFVSTGTSANPNMLLVYSNNAVATLTVSGTCTAVSTIVYGITATNPCTATNSLNMGTASGWTITGPFPSASGGSSGFIIGG